MIFWRAAPAPVGSTELNHPLSRAFALAYASALQYRRLPKVARLPVPLPMVRLVPDTNLTCRKAMRINSTDWPPNHICRADSTTTCRHFTRYPSKSFDGWYLDSNTPAVFFSRRSMGSQFWTAMAEVPYTEITELNMYASKFWLWSTYKA